MFGRILLRQKTQLFADSVTISRSLDVVAMNKTALNYNAIKVRNITPVDLQFAVSFRDALDQYMHLVNQRW